MADQPRMPKVDISFDELQPDFLNWLDAVISQATGTVHNIPLIDSEQLDLKEAQAAPLIVVLANIIEAECVMTCAEPTTHVAVD